MALFHLNNRWKFFLKPKKKYSKHVNRLELQPIQLLETVNSPSTSRQTQFDCIEDNSLPHPTLHSIEDQTKALVTFSCHLVFYE